MIRWTFSRQVALCWFLGIGYTALGRGRGGDTDAKTFFTLGFTLLAVFGIARPLIRRAVLRQSDPLARRRLTAGTAGAFWRSFLMLGRDGETVDE